MKVLPFRFAVIVCALTAARAVEPLKEQARPLARFETNAGQMMPDLRVTDIEGRAASLRAMAAGHKALVVAFMSPTCPLSAKLLPTLAAVEKEFTAAGAAFIYVDPTASDSTDAIRSAVKQHGLKGAAVHDKTLAV